MELNEKIFGQEILEKDAHVLFKRALDIRNRSRDKLREAFKDDPEAFRFYIGRKNGIHVIEDLAFVFSAKSLTKLMNRILADEADGMVLFTGAREKDDVAGAPNPDVTGRPTLIMFPFKLTESAEAVVQEFSLTNILSDGYEHPGTGGRGTGPGPLIQQGEIPAIFNSGEVFDIV
ncbi:MAG: hypothetical protein EOO04_25620 [Chitinophagaceae bacterium]|nr:MAG: hypothetical protein EOO04_25620 [Chitinophagaceae bacterium]